MNDEGPALRAGPFFWVRGRLLDRWARGVQFFGSGENRFGRRVADLHADPSPRRSCRSPARSDKIRGIVSDAAGNIYVADAGNNRIQVFDGEGTFKSQMTNIAVPQAICISGGSTQYLYSSNSRMDRGEIY